MRHALAVLAIVAALSGPFDPDAAAADEAARQQRQAQDMTLWRRADGTYSSPAPSGAWWMATGEHR